MTGPAPHLPPEGAPKSRLDLPQVGDRPRENSLAALGRDSLIQCQRLLTRWSRDPTTMIQALLYPALTLLMFRVVLGDTITAGTGQPSIYGTVPMITLVGAMFGSIVSAVGLKAERQSGLLSRFWTLPAHRASGLVGRMLAEAVRVLVTTLFIVAVGFGLGFRFNEGILAAVALLLLPIVFGIGFAMMVTALATVSGDAPLVEIVAIACTLLMFFNSGFVPVPAYPPWLQEVVANQPMSCAVDAMRGLSLGGPVLEPVLKTLAWSGGMVVLFVYPAVRGYRRAAEIGV